MLHSFLTSGGRPQITLINSIANCNFEDTTSWTASNANIAAASNVLSATGTGAAANPVVYHDSPDIETVVGNKIYMGIKGRVTNEICTKIEMYLDGTTGGTDALLKRQSSPAQNTWYYLSGVGTVGANFTGNIRMKIFNFYASAAASNNQVMELKEAIFMDLTAIFGAGAEPTAEQVDRWLTMFSAGWFGGTKAIPKRIWG